MNYSDEPELLKIYKQIAKEADEEITTLQAEVARLKEESSEKVSKDVWEASVASYKKSNDALRELVDAVQNTLIKIQYCSEEDDCPQCEWRINTGHAEDCLIGNALNLIHKGEK